jgi:hypothetical protein
MYCGVAAAEMPSWLTVAVVDDAGRLLDLRHLSDDPAGYAHLGVLLGDRIGGSPVAVDRPHHLVTQLLAAANRPMAIANEASVADFAERFCDETSYDEMQAPLGQRRAVGLARALQAGAVYVTAQRPSVEFEEFKPVLAAHAAVIAGRQAAAVALREVLRELYPAALRAYPDPADYVPLKILEVLPEPGLLTPSPSSRSRESALVAELAASGIADATMAVGAITALRVAVSESPRSNGNRLIAPVVAETVRQAAAAVRACDAASASLIANLIERLAMMTAAIGAPAGPHLIATAPVSPAPRRVAGPAAEVPAGRVSPRVSAASAAAAGVPAASSIPAPRPAPGPAPGSRANWPLAPGPDRNDDLAVVYAGGAGATAYAHGTHTSGAPGTGQREHEYGTATTLSFSLDPLNAPLDAAALQPGSDAMQPGPMPPASMQPGTVRPATVPPPWLAPDMPSEPPSLRLVENPPRDPLTDPLMDPLGDRMAPPVLRVIDGEGAGRGRRPATAAGDDVTGEQDGDLLIFSAAARTAWFAGAPDPSSADDMAWGRLADDGWRAAGQLAQPAVGAETGAGLPRRVPQANLVPGSARPPQRQLRIVRDAQSIADHTEGYFRGWRRGQEIGGFAVGQRDRAAWEFNRDQRAAREGMDQQRARLP